jgi:hypothetical protein
MMEQAVEIKRFYHPNISRLTSRSILYQLHLPPNARREVAVPVLTQMLLQARRDGNEEEAKAISRIRAFLKKRLKGTCPVCKGPTTGIFCGLHRPNSPEPRKRKPGALPRRVKGSPRVRKEWKFHLFAGRTRKLLPEIKLCGCGCGAVLKKDKYRPMRKYLRGHNPMVRSDVGKFIRRRKNGAVVDSRNVGNGGQYLSSAHRQDAGEKGGGRPGVYEDPLAPVL